MYYSSADQTDTDHDGRGNACECTDQNGDGQNDVRDLIAINIAIFNPALVTPLCDGNNSRACDVEDIRAAVVEIFSPGIPRPVRGSRFQARDGQRPIELGSFSQMV